MNHEKIIQDLFTKYPILDKFVQNEEVFWNNPNYLSFEEAAGQTHLTKDHVADAEQRLNRFASFIKYAFPETYNAKGLIESPLKSVFSFQQSLQNLYRMDLPGSWLLKCDSHLPISGSIKARGGIYEVLKHAESLAIENRMIHTWSDYSVFATEEFRDFFSNYSISVGSTGNLGLSIGIISAKLGFKVNVHMSSDAKEWKKNLLRGIGVHVVEHSGDFSLAVDTGRKEAEMDSTCFFIDDENSTDLFLGYSVAAIRLKTQLEEKHIQVNESHPLFVYLPCGVGGGPGGVTFGLKQVFGDHVHVFWGEPTQSPSMLLGLVTGLHHNISVQDIGLSNKTEADGLAVGRPSGFVGKTMSPFISGCYTIKDERLFSLLYELVQTEDITLEPSALAGVYGAIQLIRSSAGKEYVKNYNLASKLSNATHIIWATGGGMVPAHEMTRYIDKGKYLRHE